MTFWNCCSSALATPGPDSPTWASLPNHIVFHTGFFMELRISSLSGSRDRFPNLGVNLEPYRFLDSFSHGVGAFPPGWLQGHGRVRHFRSPPSVVLHTVSDDFINRAVWPICRLPARPSTFCQCGLSAGGCRGRSTNLDTPLGTHCFPGRFAYGADAFRHGRV